MQARYFFAALIILLFLASNIITQGNVYPEAVGERAPRETVVVEGYGINKTISCEKNLVLIVSGANNRITIEEGTNVSQISLGGVGNVVMIPFGQKPKIIQGGANNGVFRYS